MPLDATALALVVLGALVAGFTSGFAGFGTGLVASGLWFHALPAHMVPPLIVLASVAGQIVGLVTVRHAFDWHRAAPYLIGGGIGVPLGVGALGLASPAFLRSAVGVALVAYVLYRWLIRVPRQIGSLGGRAADALVGMGGGVLGGFAGLSGPLPLVWLQLRGGPPDRQRATYQPFNLVVLSLATCAMAVAGLLTAPVLMVALVCLPATLIGAVVGARIYLGIAPETFERVVLALLMVSGLILLMQAVAR